MNGDVATNGNITATPGLGGYSVDLYILNDGSLTGLKPAKGYFDKLYQRSLSRAYHVLDASEESGTYINCDQFVRIQQAPQSQAAHIGHPDACKLIAQTSSPTLIQH